MSAAATSAAANSSTVRRLLPRYRLAVPVDITVLKSGVPETIPGRALNLSESGLAAILAGELAPGQFVGVEMTFPHVGLPVHIKALVRHQEHLRCGVEFVALTAEQRETIRQWTRHTAAEQPVRADVETPAIIVDDPGAVTGPRYGVRILAAAMLVLLLAGGVAWWRWENSWQELENRLMGPANSARVLRLQVPAEIMQQRIVRKVDPAYPEEARERNIQGVVVMQVTVGRDGNVVSVRPVSGPEVLTPAAMEAMRWWQFEPYIVKGKAVEVETTLGLEFHP